MLGLVLVAVITPLSQYLTLRAVNADIETATPMAWVVGLIISLVLALLPLRLLAKTGKLSRPHLVILFTMLTVAVPVMNLGLVRQVFMAMYAVPSVFMFDGNNTYRTVYAGSDPDWFPVVPTREGLAWNQARRTLELLDDADARDARVAAQQDLIRIVSRLAEDIPPADSAEAIAVDAEARDAMLARLGELGVAELEAVVTAVKGKPDALRVMAAHGLIDEPVVPLTGAFAEALSAARSQSEQSADRLAESLPRTSELAVSLLAVSDDERAAGFVQNPDDLRFSKSARGWIESDYAELPDAWRSRVAEQFAWLLEPVDDAPRWRALRGQVGGLAPPDRERVARALTQELAAEVDAMDEATFTRARVSFLYRLARNERRALIKQRPGQGEPNLNIGSLKDSIAYTPADRRELEQQGIGERLGAANAEIPWDIWRTPMIMWGCLFVLIYIMLTALAELLRRKWVERENLAFPMVEVADHILRHDAALETAQDPRDPPRRPNPVNLLFISGFLLGLLYLSIEALFHYGFLASDPASTFDVSGTVLTVGQLKQMNKVFFVLSPIILGIGFLISLDLSFSIWSLFLIYTVGAAVIQGDRTIADSLYTGWGGGRRYPFPMEQLIGATLCFAGVLLWKLFRARRRDGGASESGAGGGAAPAAFLPTPMMLGGLTIVPLLIAILLYQAGVAHVGLIALVAVIAIAQAIAAARLRAESGLHTHHISYEFAKLPVVLGLTAITGASTFGMYALVAFIPMTLIWRLLPQHLENIELARRHRVSYRVIGVGSFAAFLVALVVGGLFFIHFAYLWGGAFFGEGSDTKPSSFNIARYALWTSHFSGEQSLGQLDQVHWVRVWAMVAGFAIFGTLTLLRSRFLRFPLHPMGYLILLLSIFYVWVSPYPRGEGGPSSSKETTWLWGSIFVAWAIKWLLIKYGGMNTYKKAKPAFIGLIVGSVACVFLWNMADLLVALLEAVIDFEKLSFLKNFTEEGLPPYSPRFY